MPAEFKDPYASQRNGPNELTKQYPKLSGFLQGMLGSAPDEVGAGSVLDEDTRSNREMQALGAKYGFPIGTIAQMLPFGGGVAMGKAPAAGGRLAQRGVVKMPGGNWLADSIENRLEMLQKPYANSQLEDVAAQMGIPAHDLVASGIWRRGYGSIDTPTGPMTLSKALADLNANTPEGAASNWINKTLTKYVKNEMASPKDPVRLTADAWPAKKAQMLADAQAKIDAHAAKITATAQEKGVPEHYLTEMRQQMIPLEKARDLIAERGGMHYAPQPQPYGPGEMTVLRRTRGGFPAEGLAKASQAKDWESLSDRAVQMLEPRVLIAGSDSARTLRDNPWISKLGPEDRVANLHADLDTNRDLGFDHLMDELRNAMNPNSGLPPELIWKYTDLAKKTVPDAVEHVDKINAWRAVNAAEINQARANNPATHLFKEYPESNPNGFRWVELKAPPAKQVMTPEEAEVQYAAMYAAGKPAKEAEAWMQQYRVSRDAAERNTEGRAALQDALKYEGDTMQHCVGGYCDEVIDGSTKIYSLRDAKGKPHATIEVAPPYADPHGADADIYAEATAKADAAFPEDAWGTAAHQAMVEKALVDSKQDLPAMIKQIKGFKNAKPNAEAIPYIQDFVRSGNWSDVGDLQNSGLERVSDLLTSAEVQALEKHAGEALQTFHTPQDLKERLKAAGIPHEYGALADKDGYAEGGLVSEGHHDSQRVQDLVATLKQEYYA